MSDEATLRQLSDHGYAWEQRGRKSEARVAQLEVALFRLGKHEPLHVFHPEDGCKPSCEVCSILRKDK